MPQKLIEIVRAGNTIELRINAHPTDPQKYFLFQWSTSQEWAAELLKEFLKDQISFSLSRAVDKAYLAGWRESNIPKFKRHYVPPRYLEDNS